MKNKYWISKNKYMELKYFCRQYDEWRKIAANEVPRAMVPGAWEKANAQIRLVENTIAAATDDDLMSMALLAAVTKGYSYGYMTSKLGFSREKKDFDQAYRKFFYKLSLVR